MGGGLQSKDLPEPVIEFLSDFDAVGVVGGIVTKYGVGDRRSCLSDMLSITERILRGELRIGDVPETLREMLGTGESKAKAAAIEYVIARVLPIAELVGVDAVGALKEWGADEKAYAGVKRVRAEENSKNQEPKALTATLDGAGFADPVLQHRLELVVASYRDGVRTREQAMAVLMRPVKTGGLELGEGVAGEVLEKIKIEGGEGVGGVGGGEVVEKKTKEEKANEQGGVRGGDGLTEKDDEEVRGIVEARKVAPLEPALVTDTKAAAEKIAAGAAVTFASGEMRTRFEHIMDARLRDVRDGFETRARLEAPAEQGGLGLSGAPLVAVMEAVEAMDAAHHAALGVELAKKKEALKAEKGARAEQVGQLASDDAQVMAKRYAELTGKAPKEMVVPTPSRATAAIPAAEAVARRAQQIDTGKVRAAIDAAKAEAPKVTPVLSAGSVARVASGRPTVNDVVFERKLAGPVEELRLLTLADFRRLSKDPEDAARKIEAKVELVSAEGYDQRIAAIRAWRESPLVRLYVELSREALLSGKGIDDLLSGRRAAGEDMPTEAELKAVVDLNGTLRF